MPLTNSEYHTRSRYGEYSEVAQLVIKLRLKLLETIGKKGLKAIADKEYAQRPENKARIKKYKKAWSKEYGQRTDVKEKARIRSREFAKTPRGIEYRKEYGIKWREENKEHRKSYNKEYQLKNKEKGIEYRKRPEVKERMLEASRRYRKKKREEENNV